MKTKRRWLLLGTCVVAVVIASFAVTSRFFFTRAIQTAFPADSRQILDHSQQFILYSLYPHPENMKPEEIHGRPFFHDTLILREILVNDPRERDNLLAAFYKGIGEGNGDEMACFDPQYGIRAVRNGQSVDLVICYACLQVDIYDRHGARRAYTSSSPLPMFSRAGGQ